MIKATRFVCLSALLCLCLAVPAQAQLARTFVSSLGNDANDCQRLTPCRTFQGAHDKTLANGEITVLDPGGYGAVNITKAISIINDGVGEAGVLVSGGLSGMTINAGASDSISLRGLTIKGIGFGGGDGIVFNTGSSITIENCAIRTLTGPGIRFLPQGSGRLAVSNTVVTDNASSGITVAPVGSGITVSAVLSRVELHNNTGHGFIANGGGSTGTIRTTIADSVASGHGVAGFALSAFPGEAPTSLMVVRSVTANNAWGFNLNGGNATLRAGQSAVTGNTFSWAADNGAVLRSYGDNNIDGNADGDPAPTTIAKK